MRALQTHGLTPLVLVTAIVLPGCGSAPPPPPVSVYGGASELAALAGTWNGQYWSADTGRSGTIRFELAADGTGAAGEVLMQTIDRPGDRTPANARPDVPAVQSLAIRFVRVADGAGLSVSGTLEPYRDPDCGCVLSTTFVGQLQGDVLAGTFVSNGGPGHPAAHGKWRAERAHPG